MFDSLLQNYDVLYGIIIALFVILIFLATRRPKQVSLTDRLRAKASDRIQGLLDLEKGAFLHSMEQIYDQYRRALEAEKEDPIDKL
jgi:hypothetical protein